MITSFSILESYRKFIFNLRYRKYSRELTRFAFFLFLSSSLSSLLFGIFLHLKPNAWSRVRLKTDFPLVSIPSRKEVSLIQIDPYPSPYPSQYSILTMNRYLFYLMVLSPSPLSLFFALFFFIIFFLYITLHSFKLFSFLLLLCFTFLRDFLYIFLLTCAFIFLEEHEL